MQNVTTRYRSQAEEAFPKTARGIYEAGLRKRTMRGFDELCLTPIKPLSPKKIRQLRLRENASQSVFARHLGVSTNLISQWERGEKKPQGASLKLLTLVEKNGLDYVA